MGASLVGFTRGSPHRCKNCYFALPENDKGDLSCVEGSPQMHFHQDGPTLPGQQPGFVTVAGWPRVRPEQTCGRHPMRQLEVMNMVQIAAHRAAQPPQEQEG